MSEDDYARRHEVAALRRQVAAAVARLARLERAVAELAPHGRDHARVAAFVLAVHAFAAEAPWSAAELLHDARRSGRPDLLAALDPLVHARQEPAKSLGRWLERHDGACVDGLRLARIKREGGVWLYGVLLVSEAPLP